MCVNAFMSVSSELGAVYLVLVRRFVTAEFTLTKFAGHPFTLLHTVVCVELHEMRGEECTAGGMCLCL